jgi:hypothetical protein
MRGQSVRWNLRLAHETSVGHCTRFSACQIRSANRANSPSGAGALQSRGLVVFPRPASKTGNCTSWSFWFAPGRSCTFSALGRSSNEHPGHSAVGSLSTHGLYEDYVLRYSIVECQPTACWYFAQCPVSHLRAVTTKTKGVSNSRSEPCRLLAPWRLGTLAKLPNLVVRTSARDIRQDASTQSPKATAEKLLFLSHLRRIRVKPLTALHLIACSVGRRMSTSEYHSGIFLVPNMHGTPSFCSAPIFRSTRITTLDRTRVIRSNSSLRNSKSKKCLQAASILARVRMPLYDRKLQKMSSNHSLLRHHDFYSHHFQ